MEKKVGKEIVSVETTEKNLKRIEMFIRSDNCLIIQGGLGSGKTKLVEYLADRRRKKLIKYQMDDFMDSKVNYKQFKVFG